MKYWIRVVSNDQVQTGVEGGFIQAAQDKAGPLQALAKGDVIFSYAPGTLFRGGRILQAFTAIARVVDEEAYPTQMSAGARKSHFAGVRRNADRATHLPAGLHSGQGGLGDVPAPRHVRDRQRRRAAHRRSDARRHRAIGWRQCIRRRGVDHEPDLISRVARNTSADWWNTTTSR